MTPNIINLVNKIRRIKTEQNKLEAQQEIQEGIEKRNSYEKRKDRKPVIREFLELHYPYLLQFVRKESKSVDFINIHVALAARRVFPLAVHGERPYPELDKFEKSEWFPSTTLELLKKIIHWEELHEELPVYDTVRSYLIARANYNRERRKQKDQLIRTIERRPDGLLYDFEKPSTSEEKDVIIQNLEQDPEKFVDELLNNVGRTPPIAVSEKEGFEQYHDELIEHVRSHWQYEDDFDELERYMDQMQSNFDELYNWRMKNDPMIEEYSSEKEEYGLLIRLYDELRNRYHFTEASLQPIDPDQIPAIRAEEHYDHKG